MREWEMGFSPFAEIDGNIYTRTVFNPRQKQRTQARSPFHFGPFILGKQSQIFLKIFYSQKQRIITLKYCSTPSSLLAKLIMQFQVAVMQSRPYENDTEFQKHYCRYPKQRLSPSKPSTPSPMPAEVFGLVSFTQTLDPNALISQIRLDN